MAGSTVNVLWAGGRNCPLASTERVRWWGDVEFDVRSCPRVDREWARVIPEFRPDLVVMVYSVPQQAEQQYEPDGDWFTVRDKEFDRRQREALGQLIQLGDGVSAKFAFFTSPRVYSGLLAGAPFSSDKRVKAWNKAMLAYTETWPEITLVDWASFVLEAEDGAGGPGSLRPDGVHLEAADLEYIVAGRVMPAISELLASS